VEQTASDDTLNDYRNEVMVARNWASHLYNAYFNEPPSQLASLPSSAHALVLSLWLEANERHPQQPAHLNLELRTGKLQGEGCGPWAPSLIPTGPLASTSARARSPLEWCFKNSDANVLISLPE